MDLESQELFKLPLDIDCKSNFNIPYIISYGSFNKENPNMKRLKYDLLVIGYFEETQKVKILSVKEKENSENINMDYQIKLNEPYSLDVQIYDDNYPTSIYEADSKELEGDGLQKA